ncbi:Mu transposase C-terminal domain-containing protein [Clostridium botulinum]|uniref:DDE-type integrase/transposase/recombinase n=1 Tax=Clostridium botulinum TaxID=1491 RepID=A0A6B4JPH0_CLOBO|nr:Mu transposase C-terminal domain-containing protein [Clostridium botulinum]EES49792.1 transposase protein B [Clostridium botulinum E1 str. 'BoNT E Beluga']MBY6762563.1 DDE-type integrase/transposase/recombinase [Clostridium botulinum]MBY6920987.1 DDE-type integrase/transposase/recombinase [Clostridium botulinum]MCR1132927.1 Mu transposase C-terminal domain-containing protein [Clostridium botulinum]NFH69600.1 DDE-type integrase/transposase/recombinase [Clostridium botulinum]
MIYVNSVFKYMDDENGERIRIIDIIEGYVYLVNIDAATSVPRKELLKVIEEEIDGEKLIIIKDPFSKIINEKELSEPQINKRNVAWEFIEKYWEINKYELLEKKHRENKLMEIANMSGLRLLNVKRIFSRYWQRGMNKNALLPDYINSGGKGKEKKLSDLKVGRPAKADYLGDSIEGINITDDVKKHVQFVINKYYRNGKKISLKEAYTLMLRDFYSDVYRENNEIKHIVWENERIPKYNQFYYWFKKFEDVKKDIVLRDSDKEFNLNHRPLLSNSTIETDGPGTRFQIDATIADVYLVSSLNTKRIIGRPIVYAIIDVYSRLITGIYVGLEGPSWLGAMMALDNMVADKVEFCKKYGIDITEEQWPSKHLPDIIIADRGEFEGYSPENLINNLNVKIENTSPYRGDLKGIVERNFRILNTKLKHKTPGAIQKEFRKRGDKDYRLDATLTLEAFTRIYINIVLHHNRSLIEKYPVEKEILEDDILPIPIQLWKWGIENKKGRLKTVDRDVLRLNILPRGKASVSRAGIKFKGLSYSSNKAISQQWFIKPTARSIDIVYDPRNVNKIYIPHDNGLGYEECYLLETCNQYKNCLLEEIIFNQELLVELKEKHLREQNQSNIDLEKEIEKIVKESGIEKAKELDFGESKNKQLKGIRRNRIIEKEMNRETEALKIGEEKSVGNNGAEVIELPSRNIEIDEKETSGDNRIMELLKKKRDERREK